MMKFLGALVAILLFASCLQKPTKVYQTVPTQVKGEGAGFSVGITLTDKAVIVDARPSFDFAVSHLNGAIHLPPEDFNQHEPAFRGVLEIDKFFHARRLARLGISSDTPVVVVGRGPLGNGEEGRVAWTLKVLGLKDVSFVGQGFFSLPLTTAEAPPRAPVPIWKPQIEESLTVSKADFLRASHVPRSALSAPIIIDVRSADEYLGKTKIFERPLPNLSAINIPWTEFFDSKGLTSSSMNERLNAVGVTKIRVIYVISNMGIESAAVTMALRGLGFHKASNFSGGYQELMLSGPAGKSKSK